MLAWALVAGPLWALIGGLAVPRRYRTGGLDVQRTGLIGALAGATTGPLGVAYLLLKRPRVNTMAILALTALLVGELLLGFRHAYPDNSCVTDAGYVANQIQGGLGLGLVYATMAVGLALIFSVLGIVSFTHGQFFMLGGVVAYLFTTEVAEVNPLVAVPLSAAVALTLGGVVDRTLLSPLHDRTTERPVEYALLVTFGFGLFLQYAIVGMLGANRGVRTPRYTDHPFLGIDQATFDLGPLLVRTDIWIAGIVGLLVIAALWRFLVATWQGTSMRAVAMDQQAASIVGINVRRTYTAAFSIGTALAAVAGALLIPLINFPVPQVAGQSAVRAYVIIVLGGLGSIPGALIGALMLGVTEALGAGCFPDATRGATYQVGFGLVLFAAVLLIRPNGLFGRKD